MKTADMKLRTRRRDFRHRLTVALLVFAMLLIHVPVTVFADPNQAVNDAGQGVVQVNLTYRDDDGNYIIIAQGSGFLINNDHVLTCAHVVVLDERVRDGEELSDLEYVAKHYHKKVAEVKERLGYSITVNRDVYITASLQQQSKDVDWALLKLSQPIQNKNSLPIRSSATVEQTETAYAIGFPGESALFQDINTYTSDDVTITEGIINKISVGTNLWSGQNANYIQTSVKTTSGNSGGPLVDEEGNVIGICEGASGTFFQDDYFYAVAIDQVTQVLDALGVVYTLSDAPAAPTPTEAPAPEPEPIEEVDKRILEAAISEYEKLEAKGYTEESYTKLIKKLEEAKRVNNDADATQRDVDNALDALNNAGEGLEKAKGLDMMWIIVIAAALVVLILAMVIVVVISGNKKKKASADARARSEREAEARRQAQAGPSVNSPSSVKSQGFTPAPMTQPVASTPTTLLKSDEAPTTILRKRNINGGTLVNTRSGERVSITEEEFKIGREHASVDYCITGNSSIGRLHAKIVNRNGASYLVDLNAKNGTFLNGVKCSPMQEMPLKNGDRISLSDMDFTFQI